MKVLVCGGRDFTDRKLMNNVLRRFQERHGRITWIIHGGARGADQMSGDYALDHAIPITVYPANWRQYGRSAGPVRNQQMLDEGKPDWVIAMPGGRGTADMVRRASIHGFPVFNADTDDDDQGEIPFA